MKGYVFIATLLYSMAANAQQDTIRLQEIVVEGAKVIAKTDRSIIYPSAEIIKASASGYSLIRRLSLPGIHVDEASHTITSLMNDGEVQLRINDIVAGKADMLSIGMASVVSIEYIDNPGVRYGDGIAKVINIKTRRATNGYTLGADSQTSLTSRIGNNMAYAKYNRGKNELSATYNHSYTDISDYGNFETANYLLSTGETKTITRRVLDQQKTDIGNELQLNFNWNNEGIYQFQAKLTAAFTDNPTSRSRKLITDGNDNYYSAYNCIDKNFQPTLDLYYDWQIDSTQAIRFNAVGTLINSDYEYSYDEGQAFTYTCDGRTCSLTSEAVYENRLRHFATLSAGINYQQKYVSNGYAGSVVAVNRMRFSNTYAFAQLSGRLFKRLDCVAGLGISYIYTRRDEIRLNFTLFRPKLTLQYPFGRGIKLKYSLELGQHVSQIANTSDVAVRVNGMEVEQGNPDLRPNSRFEQSVRLSYDIPRLSLFVEAGCRRNANCNMDVYYRTDDNTFVHTQRNQEQCSMFDITGYASWDIIPQKLNIGGAAYLYRFTNIGDDYRHFYTAFDWQAYANAYLGNLSFSIYADNGWNFMEGEREGHNGHSVYLSASYRFGDFNFSLMWQQPLENNHKSNSTYVRNRYVSKYTEQRCGYFSNMIYLGVTWNISRGRQYKAINKRLNNYDREMGIMKL